MLASGLQSCRTASQKFILGGYGKIYGWTLDPYPAALEAIEKDITKDAVCRSG